MKKELVKGFCDFLGEDAKKREYIKKIILETFEKYSFEPNETPIIEYEEFVKGENQEDESVSDIFKLKDKGKRNLALRYEFTFQLKRTSKNKKLPYKRFQIGEVFRDEPVSSNRFRQFTQCDVDVIGSTIKEEAEILSISNEILKRIGIDFVIQINNRKLLNEILDYCKIPEKNKEQSLREIDKYGKLSEKEIIKNLKKLKAEKFLDVLKNKEKYFEKFENYQEINLLKKLCKFYGFEISFCPMIVRGLSYYNGNIFEIKTKKIKETIAGGGSYKINNIQSTGISFGLERLSLLSNIKEKKESFLLVSLDKDSETIKIAQKLRKQNKIVSIFYGKPSKALDYANSYNFKKIIFIGKKEIDSGKIKIKDMETGKEEIFKI